MKADLYQKVTDQIVAALERGCRPWMRPWSGEHAAGRITRPLRGNGQPYQGIEPHRVCRRPFGLSYAAMAGSSSMA
jgi:antirestriction protein ArdC